MNQTFLATGWCVTPFSGDQVFLLCQGLFFLRLHIFQTVVAITSSDQYFFLCFFLSSGKGLLLYLSGFSYCLFLFLERHLFPEGTHFLSAIIIIIIVMTRDKHGKEQIVCLADDHRKNRHHTSLFVRNCKLVSFEH